MLIYVIVIVCDKIQPIKRSELCQLLWLQYMEDGSWKLVAWWLQSG